MGIKWTDLSARQQSLIEGAPVEPAQPPAQILRRPRLERDEQRIFANWLNLHALPCCWHATHKRSTATVGVFDFWIGKNGKSIWVEFKSIPIRLSVQQQKFMDLLDSQKMEWRIVHNAQEAIALIKAI